MSNKISIIIPIYNAEIYIDRCLESLINQTYKNIEIILVNDGSIDKTEEICLRYIKKDNRIVYKKIENQGPLIARKSGFEIASGDYITTVDIDDYIDKRMYERLITVAMSEDADIVQCGYASVYNNKVISNHCNKNLSNFDNSRICTSYYYESNGNISYTLWNKLFKKQLFDNIQYLKIYNDS